MTFVLSAIRPPEGGARYGKAVLCYFASAGSAIELVGGLFSQSSDADRSEEAKEIALGLVDAPGREIRHDGTGLTFRVDPLSSAPHPCPCCGRLVLPDDHAYADAEDAFCPGCFTWDRNVPACLPENSAHANSND